MSNTLTTLETVLVCSIINMYVYCAIYLLGFLYHRGVCHGADIMNEGENRTAAPSGGAGSTLWLTRDGSILTIIIIDTVVTLICGCLLTACVMWRINKRARRREERDKLSTIIQVNYWENEDHISKLLQIFSKMINNVLFRDITEMHIFAYKYRIENEIYGPRDTNGNGSKFTDSNSGTTKTLTTIKKVERLFEMLMLQLPCHGSCPLNIASAFGSTIYSLSINTSLLWDDHKGRLIRSIVHYFAGRSAAERFDSDLMSDEQLETLVLARVPYVHQLYFNEDHFVMHDVEITGDLKVDLKNKIRYVDTVLSKGTRHKALQSKEKNIIECYYLAREICIKNQFVQHQTHLPDIVTKVGEPSKLGEAIVFLRHLLRVMCMPKNIRKLEMDDKFFQFLMQLHEALYTWSDTNTMVEILERIRNNIYGYLKSLTMEQMLVDKEFTKAKLEHLEKELYKHLNYLTLKQVQQEKHRSYPGAEGEMKMKSAGSDSSIYTMAASVSSLMRQTSQEQHHQGGRLELMHQQHSMDQASLISSSSMYATALTLSSTNEALLRRSPPPPSHSPSDVRSPPQSRGRSPNIERQHGPLHGPDLPPGSDPNEYFETAV